MKKIIFAFAVAMAACLTSNAQLFVGGSLGVDVIGSKTKHDNGNSVDGPTNSSFSLSPKAGYYLNEKMAVGAEIGFNRSAQKSGNNKSINFGFGIGAFARYKFVSVDRFDLLLEGQLGIVASKDKYKSGSSSSDGSKYFNFGTFVLPVLSYNLTDKLSIEATCDFVRLGLISNTETKQNDDKDRTTVFGFGVNSGDGSAFHVFDIGIIYKF